MTEFELKKTLEQEIEIPSTVEEHIQKACAQAKSAPRAVRRSRRPLRTALVAAAVIAVLSVSAAASYAIVRGEVPTDIGAALEGFFGNESRSSVESNSVYDESGKLILGLPNKEQVPVDETQAEALVGDYLPDTGYVWQIGEYTVTVESYLLDENTGTAKVCYSLYRPGGVEGFWDGSGIRSLLFRTLVDGEWETMSDKEIYVDQSRSTSDTIYIMDAMINAGNWSAESGLHLEFRDMRLNQDSDPDANLVATMELPGLESLPAVTVTDPETEDPVAVFSAIGIKVRAEAVDMIREITLTYADGSKYVVLDKAANVENYDYALWSRGLELEAPKSEGLEVGPEVLPAQAIGQRYLHCCFNRLVDPEQVVAVTVNGMTYSAKS